jgi:hypothetical protein
VKSLPSLWGLLLLLSYFAQGTPFPKQLKERLAALGGPKAPALASAALHIGSGLLMAVALFTPLVLWPDPDYPLRSPYPTLFEALGHAGNAPVMMGLYQLVQQVGPTLGYSLIAALTLALGTGLGLAGLQAARFKDQMYDELGPIKYAIMMGLLLMMVGVLGKVALRLLFGLKYLISFPAVSFNI